MVRLFKELTAIFGLFFESVGLERKLKLSSQSTKRVLEHLKTRLELIVDQETLDAQIQEFIASHPGQFEIIRHPKYGHDFYFAKGTGGTFSINAACRYDAVGPNAGLWSSFAPAQRLSSTGLILDPPSGPQRARK